jgi:hypothetical protein
MKSQSKVAVEIIRLAKIGKNLEEQVKRLNDQIMVLVTDFEAPYTAGQIKTIESDGTTVEEWEMHEHKNT